MRSFLHGKPPRIKEPNSRNISAGVRSWILERDEFKCRRCGHAAVHGVQLVVDHVVPFSRGGLTEITNLQTLCTPCNAGKSDRDPHPHDLDVSGVVLKPAKQVDRGLVGVFVIKPAGKGAVCGECGEAMQDYRRGVVGERMGPSTYLVQWESWLDGEDTYAEIAREQDIKSWFTFAAVADFDAACRWVLASHDHEGKLSWANYGELEPPRLSLEPKS